MIWCGRLVCVRTVKPTQVIFEECWNVECTVLSTNLVVKGDAFLKLVDVFFFHMLFRQLETRVFFSLLFFCKGGRVEWYNCGKS